MAPREDLNREYANTPFPQESTPAKLGDPSSVLTGWFPTIVADTSEE